LTALKTFDEQLKDLFDVKEYRLDDKGMYDGFWKGKEGFNREWVPREKSFWWVEDLVKDTLEKKKVFGDRPVILTRNLTHKDKFSLGSVFKGAVSPIDLWIPGYGFGEIKYAGNCERDQWGYDLTNHAINNIWSVLTLEDNMISDIWKNNKLFLIVVHCPDPGDAVSISVIDLYDKFDFVSPWGKKKTTKPRLHPNLSQVCVNVRSENCLVRFDNVPYRTYRKRCHEEKY